MVATGGDLTGSQPVASAIHSGPSGWTRTTTARVKSPACCVDTTEGSWTALERMAGFEPAPQGLEGPQAAVTPHSLWFGLRVSNPSLRVGRRGMLPPHPGRTRTGDRRPMRHPSVVKDPALVELGGRQGIRTQLLPLGERCYRPSADHPHVPPVLATAPGFEPGPASFGGSDAPVTPRCRCHFTSRPFSKTEPPCDLARASLRASGQNKKGLLGDRPRRPVSQ